MVMFHEKLEMGMGYCILDLDLLSSWIFDHDHVSDLIDLRLDSSPAPFPSTLTLSPFMCIRDEG